MMTQKELWEDIYKAIEIEAENGDALLHCNWDLAEPDNWIYLPYPFCGWIVRRSVLDDKLKHVLRQLQCHTGIMRCI